MLYNVNMKVYRYLSEDELNAIKSGQLDKIGNEFNREFFKKTNTHKYKAGVKYLHFFKSKKDVKYIKEYYRNYKGKFYTCEFDIPVKVLKKGIGFAKYTTGTGYDIYNVKKLEFIVPVCEFKKEWLIGVVKQASESDKDK